MKKGILLLFILPTFCGYSQHDSVLYKHYSFTYTKYNVYGFYDFVRLAGAGIEYRPNPIASFDLKMGVVYPSGIFSSSVFANDYFLNRGVGASFSPRLHGGIKKRFFVGLNIAFYSYGYKNQWTERGVGFDKYTAFWGPHELRDRSTTAVAIGATLGYTINIKKINLELFLGLANEHTSSVITIRQQEGGSSSSYQYPYLPYSYLIDTWTPNVLAGIKIGFGFKKQTACSQRYYGKLIRNLISVENETILNMYRTGEITRDQLQGYYKMRNQQYLDIKNAYRFYYSDNNYMENMVFKAYRIILQFVAKNFKK